MLPVKLVKAQRQHLADKLMDSANAILGGLVIGQIVVGSSQPVLIATGVAIYILAVIITTKIRKGG